MVRIRALLHTLLILDLLLNLGRHLMDHVAGLPSRLPAASSLNGLAHRMRLKLHAAQAGWAQNACATHNERVAQASCALMQQTAHRVRLKLNAAPAGWAQDACATHNTNAAQESCVLTLQAAH